MANPDPSFQELLATHQSRLLNYIISLIADPDSAWDVLQETNRVLLEKRSEFRMGTSFVNWSLSVAQYQTMAWLRDRSRNRMIVTAEIVELLADDAVTISAGEAARRDALNDCLETLSVDHRKLLHLRYGESNKLTDLEQQTGRSVSALKQMFFRLRATLGACIETKLGEA